MEKIDYFSSVPDPRVKGRCKHKLSDILIIAIATYLCGGDDYASMYEFCKHRGESLKPLVELPNGCPSVDTIERVISRIDPTAFAECLSVFGSTLVDDLKGKLVSIDGKRIRGSKSSNSYTHILSAWVDEHTISIAGKAVEEKSNEITVIPDVLDSIDLTGAVVSIDAMGTQTDIAQMIVESEADYVLALKRNHRHLSEDVKDAFTGRYTQFIYSTLDKDHGRVEERIYTALRPQEVLDESQYEPWKNLSSLVQVERLVTFSDGTERRDKQYYLSSLPAEAVERIGTYIRGHWGIENRLHWHLDVTFREDHCRARKVYAAQNLNTIRKLALAIVSQRKDKLSIRKRLFTAALNIDYLKELLKI